MCGIVYKHNFDGEPVNNDIMQQFDLQRHRGVQGFGLFDGQETHIIKASKEDNILKWLCKYQSNLILFHHRYPTSTVNVKRAAHPFSTRGYFGDTQYILIHNGSVNNANDLFVKHQELGIEYKSLLQDMTFNDSEALLWDFALTMEGKQKELTAYGGIAFICLKLVKGKMEKMYFARNYSKPLKFKREDNSVSISSEGDGDEVPVQKLHTWNYDLKRLTKRNFTVNSMAPGAFTNSGFSNNSSYDRYGKYIDINNYSYSRGTAPHVPYRMTSDDDRVGFTLGEFLRKKYRHLLERDDDYSLNPGLRDVEDYVENENGFYMPQKTLEEIDEDDAIIDFYSPEVGQVETSCIEYLIKFKGHFEQALWSLECDYEDLSFEPEDADNIRKRLLLERTMESLQNDPEYTNEESVSSLWEALWQQQALAA